MSTPRFFQASTALSRRRLLGNLTLGAGASLLAPFLSRLAAEDSGATAKPPRRVVFLVEGNGVSAEHLVPRGVVRPQSSFNSTAHNVTDAQTFREVTLAGHELPFCLEPLAPFRDRLAIVQGLSGRVCEGGHSVNFGALGQYGGQRGPAGETIDAALAKALPAPFPHVGLGITHNPNEVLVQNVSAWDAGRALPTMCQPDAAMYALFGSIADGAKDDFAANANVLDFLRGDLKRLSHHLAGPERAKLENYENSLAVMRARHDQITKRSDLLKRYAPQPGPSYTSLVETERLDAHVEIGAAALIAGLTNVLTIASGCGGRYFEVTFKGLGISIDKHQIGHGGGENGKSGDELAQTIRRFHIELMAKLAAKLQVVPEGNGTMLDNTAIIYLSDSANAHHATCWEWPTLILGDLGGRLKTKGRYLEYPRYGRTGHRTMGCLYATLLHAAGAPRDSFGQFDKALGKEFQQGPLSDLLS